MIFKKDLLDAIDTLTAQVAEQGELIVDLQKRVTELENKLNCEVPVKRAKRSGKVSILADEAKDLARRKVLSEFTDELYRDTKKRLTKIRKSTNAKKQPRNKDGKFAKK